MCLYSMAIISIGSRYLQCMDVWWAATHAVVIARKVCSISPLCTCMPTCVTVYTYTPTCLPSIQCHLDSWNTSDAFLSDVALYE